MLRSIGAVLAGYISIGILVVLTDKIMGGMNPGDLNPGQPIPGYYFAVSIFTALIYSIAGGYLCAWLAKPRAVSKCVLGLIIFGEIMGVASTFMTWKVAPHWYSFALLVLFPPCVWLGGLLRTRKTAIPYRLSSVS